MYTQTFPPNVYNITTVLLRPDSLDGCVEVQVAFSSSRGAPQGDAQPSAPLPQDRQIEDAAASAAAEIDARALEEVRDREARLEAALAEAQASVANMRRLHQASQSQLFTMQASLRPTALRGPGIAVPSELTRRTRQARLRHCCGTASDLAAPAAACV